MPRTAGHVVVTERTIEIDGQEFPWHTTPGGASATTDADGRVTLVTLVLYADRCDFVTPPPPEEDE